MVPTFMFVCIYGQKLLVFCDIWTYFIIIKNRCMHK